MNFEIDKEIDRAAEQAKKDSEVSLSELYNIYIHPYPNFLVRGCNTSMRVISNWVSSPD